MDGLILAAATVVLKAAAARDLAAIPALRAAARVLAAATVAAVARVLAAATVARRAAVAQVLRAAAAIAGTTPRIAPQDGDPRAAAQKPVIARPIVLPFPRPVPAVLNLSARRVQRPPVEILMRSVQAAATPLQALILAVAAAQSHLPRPLHLHLMI